MKLKLRKELLEIEDKSYASDTLVFPEDGVDCYEGCNPYGFPPELEEAAKEFNIEKFGPYPHSKAVFEGLKEYWANAINLEYDNLLITDGSIQAIYIVNDIFANKGAKVLGVAPQFTDCAMDIVFKGMEYDPIYMKKENNYKIDVDEIIDKITPEYSMVYIDNPNNPTGQIIDVDDIDRILRKAKKCNVAVVVDEAYGDFMEKKNSAIWFLDKYDNMILLRTMSKGFGLAGLRVGLIITNKRLISIMKKITNPYQVSDFAREMAGVALRNGGHISSHMKDFAKMKKEIRANLKKNLHMMESCDTVSICTLYHENKDVNLTKKFFDQGVLLVDGDDFDGLDKSFVRVRLPKIEEFPKLLEAVKTIDSEEF